MKKKIIAFFSVLLILSVSVGGILVFATTTIYSSTSSTFSATCTSDVTKLTTKNGSATISAVNSVDSGNMKHVEVTVFNYKSSSASFVEGDSAYTDRTETLVSTSVSTSNATNIRVYGQIGTTSSNIELTGVKDTIILNLRKTSSVPYLPDFYLI